MEFHQTRNQIAWRFVQSRLLFWINKIDLHDEYLASITVKYDSSAPCVFGWEKLLYPESSAFWVSGLAQATICVHSGQTHDACAVPTIILQRKIQTNVKSFTLTAKLNAVFENFSFLRWVCVFEMKKLASTSFIGAKFGLSGQFIHRFHRNFALLKVRTNSKFMALKNRKWCCFLRLTTVEQWTIYVPIHFAIHFTAVKRKKQRHFRFFRALKLELVQTFTSAKFALKTMHKMSR